MLSSIFFLLLLPFFLSLEGWAQSGPTNWTATPFNPPALPLAVRSPYFNVWLAQGNNPLSPFATDSRPWAMFTNTDWYASVVVDNKEYRMLGGYFNGENIPQQTAVEFTATRTSFIMSAGGIQFNMSFLTPIEPTDLMRQSLPFAYLYMTAESTDGLQHRVRMYSDIAGNLIAGDTSKVLQWSQEDSTDYVVLSMNLADQVPYVEDNIHPQDATGYYGFKKIAGANTSWSIANIDRTRGVFVGNPSGGNLNNQADPASRFRPVGSGSDTPVLGIAVDWGNITSTPEPAVWTLGVIRNPSVQYQTPDGAFQDRKPYFTANFSDGISATKFMLDDFSRAQTAAAALDAQLSTAGSSYSSQYADILSLSARQAMGAMDITIFGADTSDVKIFMKNLGSVGSDNETIASVNNVDVLYAAFPILLYLNPDIGGYLLAPLLEFQDSSAYKLPYAARNIGTAYPSAISNNLNDPHVYGVDETANMLIMTLAYSQASGNGTLLGKHYTLLQRWAEYLGNNSITPNNQSSGDFSANSDFVSANQTNLALKGIIGVAAMAKIAEVAKVNDDQKRFSDKATSAIQFWQEQTLASSHVNFFYGDTDSNGIMYNLYADKLLQLGLVPDSVYDTITQYYQSTASQIKFGAPLDNSPNQNTTTNWMMFAAATTTNNATRDLLVSQIHAYASNNLNNVPFTSIYNPITGRGEAGSSAGIASPAQGGVFALLALNIESKAISIPPNGNTIPGSPANGSSTHKPKVAVIIGAVIAGIIVIGAVLAVGIFFYLRRRRFTRREHRLEVLDMQQSPPLLRPYLLSHYDSEETKDVSYVTASSNSPPMSQDPPSTAQTRSEGGPPQSIGQLIHVPLQQIIDRKIDPSTSSGVGQSQLNPSVSSNAAVSQGAAGDRDNVDPSAAPAQGMDNFRSEFEALRRDVERIRQERLASAEAPPSYSDPL